MWKRCGLSTLFDSRRATCEGWAGWPIGAASSRSSWQRVRDAVTARRVLAYVLMPLLLLCAFASLCVSDWRAADLPELDDCGDEVDPDTEIPT